MGRMEEKVGDKDGGNTCDCNYGGGGGVLSYAFGNDPGRITSNTCGNCYKCNKQPGTYSCSASCVLDNTKDSMCTNADAWALSRPELPDAPKPTDFKMEPVPNNISCQDCSNHLNIQDSKSVSLKDVEQLNMCIAGGGQAPGQLGLGNINMLWQRYKNIILGAVVFIFVFMILLILL